MHSLFVRVVRNAIMATCIGAVILSTAFAIPRFQVYSVAIIDFQLSLVYFWREMVVAIIPLLCSVSAVVLLLRSWRKQLKKYLFPLALALSSIGLVIYGLPLDFRQTQEHHAVQPGT